MKRLLQRLTSTDTLLPYTTFFRSACGEGRLPSFPPPSDLRRWGGTTLPPRLKKGDLHREGGACRVGTWQPRRARPACPSVACAASTPTPTGGDCNGAPTGRRYRRRPGERPTATGQTRPAPASNAVPTHPHGPTPP